MSSTQFVKVFGERNSATRAIIRMLNRCDGIRVRAGDGPTDAQLAEIEALREQIENLRPRPWRVIYEDAIQDMLVQQSSPTIQWKHAAPEWHPAFAEENAKVLFAVRNPYSWFLSLVNRPYHKRGIFRMPKVKDSRIDSLPFVRHWRERKLPQEIAVMDFIDRPWLTIGRDNIDPVIPSPMDLWNRKLRAYDAFARQANPAGVATTTVRFEDFVHDPVPTLEAAFVSLDLTGYNLNAVEESTKEADRSHNDIKAYYNSEAWKEKLSRPLVERINHWVDWSIANSHGYEMLDPADFPKRPPREYRRMRYTYRSNSSELD